MGWIDPNTVFGDANFAGCKTRTSSVVGVSLWSGQFLKAWCKNSGHSALSSGETELAAVVRAATEGGGLQLLQTSTCVATEQSSPMQPLQLGWFIDSDWELSDSWPLEICGFIIPIGQK